MKIFFGFFNPFFLCVLDKGYNSSQKAVEDAENFLRMNVLSFEQVSQGTGLPLEQVKEIAEKIGSL